MINIAVELVGVVICLLGIVQTLINAKFDRSTERYFVSIFSCLIVFSFS